MQEPISNFIFVHLKENRGLVVKLQIELEKLKSSKETTLKHLQNVINLVKTALWDTEWEKQIEVDQYLQSRYLMRFSGARYYP